MYRSVRVIPKQLLLELYVEKAWSLRDVAEYFQCSVDTIIRRMKAYDIDRRPLKKDINMVHVQSLYETGGWSLQALATHYNVSVATMANRMRQFGLLCSKTHKIIPMDAITVCKSYESGNSVDAIARMYGISRWKVYHILRHMGVQVERQPCKIERIEEMVYLYRTHRMSTDDIALAYGIRGTTVSMYLQSHGVILRTKTLALDERRIKILRAEGYGISKIAQIMGCSTSAIRKRLSIM